MLQDRTPHEPSLRLRVYKLAIAVALTFAAVALEWHFFRHAGPLWRDEANSANLAGLGTWAAIQQHAQYDSFPLVWNICLWILANAGWTHDYHLRLFGLLAAWVQLGALWWAARACGLAVPLVSLVLYALAPSAVVYGTMFRGYGLGAAAFLIATAMLVRFVQAPSLLRATALALANIAALQSNFANGVLLAATHTAAALSSWRSKGQWVRTCALLAVAFGLTAASLGLCWSWIRYALEVGSAEQRPVQLAAIAAVWWESLGTTSVAALLPLWLGALLCTSTTLWQCVRRSPGRYPSCVLALAAAFTVAMMLVYFWQVARLPSQQWHYLSLNALLALASDTALHRWLTTRRQSVQALAFTAIAACGAVVAWQSWPLVAVRMTNVDLIANVIERQAKSNDLVVVAPWYCGLSFARYYRGAAPWITLPDLPDHRFHYHLQIRAKIALGDDGTAEERLRIQKTLQAGGRVWLVGDLTAPPPGAPAPTMPRGPHPVTGWRAGPYLDAWEMQVAALLRDHAEEIWGVELPPAGTINPWENLRLTVIEGWR